MIATASQRPSLAPLLLGALALLHGLAWAQPNAAAGAPNAAAGAPKGGASVPKGAGASTEAPMSRPAIERQDTRAQLMPRRYTTIAAEIGAKVSRLYVAEGGAFRAGQALVAFDCAIQQAQVERARAELDSAGQTFNANVKLAKLNSASELELELSRAAVGKAKAELNANTAVLSKCGVAAPFAGRVAEQKVREQQYVQPGQALLDIIDDSVLELEFLVPSRWLLWLKPGGRFEIRIDETGKTYPAKFVRIGARVDPVSQSVKVAAAIDGHFAELVAGMSGQVRITPP